jgi:hypothetical protein
MLDSLPSLEGSGMTAEAIPIGVRSQVIEEEWEICS